MSQLLQQMMKNRENAGIAGPAILQSTQHPEKKPTGAAAGAGAAAEPTRKFIIAEKPGKKMVQTYFKLMVERCLEESSSDEE